MKHCRLTQLSSTVEDVFAGNDLPRAAETLANMRRCLNIVAEFANIRKQLEVLEDKLDSMVQPRLTDAITNCKIQSHKYFYYMSTMRYSNNKNMCNKCKRKRAKRKWHYVSSVWEWRRDHQRVNVLMDLSALFIILQFFTRY